MSDEQQNPEAPASPPVDAPALHPAEQALEDLAQAMAEDLPEPMRALLPASLPAGERIKWMRQAMKAAPVATSGPDSRRPGNKPPVDISSLSPHAMRAMGYKT